jgi:hypothetical protein
MASEQPYLEEGSLGRFLRERLDPDILYDRAVPRIAERFRPDYRCERLRLIIEFDGNQHYQRAAHVVRDHVRDRVLEAAGYRVIRIPYFVQMTPPVIRRLFGESVTDTTSFKDYPHGFIAKEVVFPADFCELGVQRFLGDLEKFSFIAADIRASLDAAVERLGDWRLVYPPSILSRC